MAKDKPSMSWRTNWRAMRALGSGDYQKVIQTFEDTLKRDPHDPYANGIVARCYEWLSEPRLALQHAERYLAAVPSDADTLLLAARCSLEIGEEEEAYRYARAALSVPITRHAPVPQWLLWLLKPLELFPKLRGLGKRAVEDFEEGNTRMERSIRWAKEYVEWYEGNRSSGKEPRVH